MHADISIITYFKWENKAQWGGNHYSATALASGNRVKWPQEYRRGRKYMWFWRQIKRCMFAMKTRLMVQIRR